MHRRLHLSEVVYIRKSFWNHAKVQRLIAVAEVIQELSGTTSTPGPKIPFNQREKDEIFPTPEP